MLVVFLIFALLALSYILSKSTDYLVLGIEQLSRGTAVKAYGITTLLVALATSLPELFVAVASSLEGSGLLSLGLVLGSNIANISLVIGAAAFISGVVKARDELFWRDVLYAFLISMMPMLLLLDGQLSRIDGVILVGVYLVYSIATLKGKERDELEDVEREYYQKNSLRHKILNVFGHKDVEQGLLRMVVGSVALIISSDLIVKLAQTVATELSVPVILVGLFMVSVGTSLPELAFEIKTVAKREYLMAFGNIIGSTVVNSSLVLGISSIINPIALNGDSKTYYISVIGFVVIFSLFWFLTRTKRQLDRVEGALLVIFYFCFVAVQLWFSCATECII